ncbi:MAG: OmpH family outer membrane protein [Bacteroidota bacterium]
MQIKSSTLLFGMMVILLSVGGSLIANSYLNKPKIAFVRSQDIIYKYEGTVEAMTKFNNQKQQWQANVDTLKYDFQRAVNWYNQEYPALSVAQRQQREEGLSKQERQLQSYASAISDKIKQANEEMMQASLDQINVFVEEYSQKHGYDIILGTTLSGSVLYGSETLDITDQLLDALNKNYHGE